LYNIVSGEDPMLNAACRPDTRHLVLVFLCSCCPVLFLCSSCALLVRFLCSTCCALLVFYLLYSTSCALPVLSRCALCALSLCARFSVLSCLYDLLVPALVPRSLVTLHESRQGQALFARFTSFIILKRSVLDLSRVTLSESIQEFKDVQDRLSKCAL